MKRFSLGWVIVVAVCVITAVGAVALFAPMVRQAVGWFQDEYAKEGEREQLFDDWEPPAADVETPEDLQKLPNNTLFPSKVGDAWRESVDDNAAIPDLSMTHKGKHAVYKVGSDTVDAYAFVVTAAEKQALITSIRAQYKQAEATGGRRQFAKSDFQVYLETPEAGQNHLWFLKDGWLYVFRTKTGEAKEPFVMDCLKLTSGKGKPRTTPTSNKDTGDKKPDDKGTDRK